MGAPTVFINGKQAHRLSDATQHCGGTGTLIEGSPNVIVGNGAGGSRGSSRSGGGTGGFGGSGDSTGSADFRAGGGSRETSTSGGTASAGQACHGGRRSQQQRSSSAGGERHMQRQQGEHKHAEKPIRWQVLWDDGRPVKGFTSRFLASSGGDEKTVDPDVCGSHDEGQHPGGTLFSVALVGKVEARGQVKTHCGNAVTGARVHIERAFGPSVDTTTDDAGSWSVGGFVEDEPFEVAITEPAGTIEGKVTEHDGKALAGAIVHIERSYGAPIEVETDANGRYGAQALVENEDYAVIVIPPGEKAEGKVRDEHGRPMAGARVRLERPDQPAIEVTTDANGTYRLGGFRNDVAYLATIVTASGEAEGTFVNERGVPVANVQAKIYRSSGGQPIHVSTDGSGRFHAKGLIPDEDYVLDVVHYRV